MVYSVKIRLFKWDRDGFLPTIAQCAVPQSSCTTASRRTQRRATLTPRGSLSVSSSLIDPSGGGSSWTRVGEGAERGVGLCRLRVKSDTLFGLEIACMGLNFRIFSDDISE